MALYKVKHLAVVSHDNQSNIIGFITHEDILMARKAYNEKENLYKRYIAFNNKRNARKS
jgi:hypothetical protein